MAAAPVADPQGKFGRHECRLARYGRSVEQLAPKFECDVSRYTIAREG